MNKYFKMCAPALLALSLAACGTDKAEESPTSTNNAAETSATETQAEQAKTQTITYLGEKYEVPADVKNIVTASLESMEDAAMLGIKPAGVLEVGGKIPSYLASELEDAELIGNKMEPNAEAILVLIQMLF